MKKIFIISALALIFSFNAKAIEFRSYISGKVNSNFVNYDIKDGENFKKSTFSSSFAVGFFSLDSSLPLRTEFEFSILSKTKKIIDSGIINLETKFSTYYLNFYYDFYNLNSNFIPYIDYGLGFTDIDILVKNIYRNKSKKIISFSWQIGTGSYYKVNNNLLIDLGFKYNQTSFNSIDLDTNMIILSLGLRYNF